MTDGMKTIELNEEDLDSIAGGGSRSTACIAKCTCGWSGSTGKTYDGAMIEAQNHKNTGCTGEIYYEDE